ncbi:hypothetical protein EYF80_022590 [Liparis tanakae]|uniref:Uncharacterized protein n=1 Tax=Liparis tanakae TaxID=230148 RepID=A0A4Z2HQ87_9TELE|nr:hypothetical protein EYF80_022590 [Liparis tanakae]
MYRRLRFVGGFAPTRFAEGRGLFLKPPRSSPSGPRCSAALAGRSPSRVSTGLSQRSYSASSLEGGRTSRYVEVHSIYCSSKDTDANTGTEDLVQ